MCIRSFVTYPSDYVPPVEAESETGVDASLSCSPEIDIKDATPEELSVLKKFANLFKPSI